jgi:hypothetical protein
MSILNCLLISKILKKSKSLNMESLRYLLTVVDQLLK